MSRTIVTLIAVLLTTRLFAQTSNQNIQFDYPRTLSEQVVNPTAEASAMLRYRDCPVSYATGTADVTVPVLSWKEGDIDMSLSLSYHTGGSKSMTKPVTSDSGGHCADSAESLARSARCRMNPCLL